MRGFQIIFITFALVFCGILFPPVFFSSASQDTAPPLASLLDDIKNEIRQKEEEIRRLETEKGQFEKTIAEKRSAQRSLNNQIALLSADVERLSVQLRITAAEIAKTRLDITSLDVEIAETSDRIAAHKQRMRELLKTVQERADEHKTLLSLMLENSPMSSFFSQLAYAERLQDELLKRTNTLAENKIELQQEQTSLVGKKEDLEELRARLSAENSAKSYQQNQKTNLLRVTKNEEQRFKKLLTETEEKRQDILKEIKELEDKLRRTIDPASLPAFRPGVLLWPVKGAVSQEYGDTGSTGFINDAYQFHNGIDIAGHTGTPIRAPRDGTIVAIGDNSPYAYGKWLAVDHGNNLTTLYAHLSSYASLARQGSAVKAGQVIGYMGATGYATGPHLHFTVYASNTFITEQRWFGLLPLGGSIDPRSYLP